jgi:hypothetical protein
MKYLVIVLVLAACSSEPKPTRPNVAPRMAEIRAELKRLNDSFDRAPHPETYGKSDEFRDSVAKAEGAVIRRLTHLEIEHDSLANILKKWKEDSILKNK